MMKVTTATGKEYQAKWFGTSTLDGIFRASLMDVDMNTAFSVFTDTAETEVITLYHDSMTPPTELRGYTVFQGISADGDGVVISLKKG